MPSPRAALRAEVAAAATEWSRFGEGATCPAPDYPAVEGRVPSEWSVEGRTDLPTPATEAADGPAPSQSEAEADAPCADGPASKPSDALMHSPMELL